MPKFVRAVLVAALAAVLALATAGCGSDVEETNNYVDAVNTAQTDFARTFDKLQTQITAQTTAKQDSETLKRFESAIDGVVADLKAVEPPEKVKALHRQLIDAIGGYGDTIAKAREEFGSSDASKVLAARTQLSTDVARTSTRINQTIDAINRRLRQ